MSNYYFVTSLLPRLQFGEKPEISFDGLMDFLRANLSGADWGEVVQLRRLVDLYNLCAYWRGEPFEVWGNLNEVQLEEELQRHEELPDYFLDFLLKYDTSEKRLAHHAELVHLFFQEVIEQTRGLLQRYFEFERGWRLVMTAFRAKKLGRDLAYELQYEDPTDELVGQLMAQRDAKELEPPDGFEELRPIFIDEQDNPRQLDRALEAFRFRKVGEMRETELFSLDYILGYAIQLMILEKEERCQR